MALSTTKYQQALVFFVTNCNNNRLGLVKLNKLFYYLDFISYRDRSTPVTNETYIHLQMGPLAKNLENQIEQAVQHGLISVAEKESDKYGTRNMYKPVASVDLSVFDEYEKKLLHEICKEFSTWSTDKMIAQTHTEAPWVYSEPNKKIDYELAEDIEILSKEEVCA
jgi:uncharacterized phage-associated protein